MLFSGFTPSSADKFFLLSRADSGLFSSYFANAGEAETISLGGGYTGTITYFADSALGATVGGNDIAIYNVVPEPGSSVVLLAGFGCLLGLRRPTRRTL